VGALNKLDGIEHRRDALWQVERAGKLEGPLLRQNSDWLREASDALPLAQMNTEERLVADYAGTGLTVGKHPMHYRRQELQSRNVLSAVELRRCRDGEYVRAADVSSPASGPVRPRASSSSRWKMKPALRTSS
jgi:error-prone DNA polymerase